MAQKSRLSTGQNRQASPIKPILVGAVAGLILILVFVLGVDEPNPAWGRCWMIKPLVLTPLVGAMGGLFYYFMKRLNATGFNKILATVIGILGFIVALWIGVVLGLNGTMWN